MYNSIIKFVLTHTHIGTLNLLYKYKNYILQSIHY